LGQLLIQYAQDSAIPETKGCADYGASVLRPRTDCSNDTSGEDEELPIDKGEVKDCNSPDPEPDRHVPGGLCTEPMGPCQVRQCQGEPALLVKTCRFFNSAGNTQD